MVALLKVGTAVLTIAVWGLPLMLIVFTALRPETEIFRFGTELSLFSFVPRQPTLDAFADALAKQDFLRQVLNTLLIGLIQASTTVAVCLMAAYPIARSQGGVRRFLMAALAIVLFIPYQAIVVPLYLIVRDFGLLNSWTGLIIPWLASPMSLMMLKNAIDELPAEIDEAARLDGAGPVRTLFQIVLPNIVPSVATVWVINMVGIYDSLLWPLISINDPSLQVAQVGLVSFFTDWERPSFATAFAASLIVVAPLLPLVLLFQRQFAQTFASSGLK